MEKCIKEDNIQLIEHIRNVKWTLQKNLEKMFTLLDIKEANSYNNSTKIDISI